MSQENDELGNIKQFCRNVGKQDFRIGITGKEGYITMREFETDCCNECRMLEAEINRLEEKLQAAQDGKI